jgi:hypothetical protein
MVELGGTLSKVQAILMGLALKSAFTFFDQAGFYQYLVGYQNGFAIPQNLNRFADISENTDRRKPILWEG